MFNVPVIQMPGQSINILVAISAFVASEGRRLPEESSGNQEVAELSVVEVLTPVRSMSNVGVEDLLLGG